MLKLLIIALIILIIPKTDVFPQKEAYNWYFGRNAGITFINGPPEVLLDGRMDSFEGCATISDYKGALLFYTDGIHVWNSANEIMENGFDLKGNPSATQSGIIVPFPGNKHLYYIFTVIDAGKPDGLNYSIVDISENGGLGKVITKNIFLHSPVTEKVTAVNYSNFNNSKLQDIWVVAHDWDSNAFRAYLIDENGLDSHAVISNVGIQHAGPNNYAGYMKASPGGDKLASVINGSAIVQICDFDTKTGTVSNCFNIQNDTLNSPYGLEFSPDGSKLYVSTITPPSKIIQYDMTAGTPDDIITSEVVIATESRWEYYFAPLQLGPDKKIYIGKYENDFLDAIAFPNKKGLDCDFEANAADLKNRMCIWGLPTFIQSYFFDPGPCDNMAFSIDSIDNSSPLRLVGDAEITGQSVRTSKAEISSVGAAWYQWRVPVRNGFTCEFSFRISNAQNDDKLDDGSLPGGDGLAFVIQNSRPDAKGRSGSGIGYATIPNSIAFEIDLFHNALPYFKNVNDPNGNHIAIQSGGQGKNSSDHIDDFNIALNDEIIEIVPDSTVYYVKIEYDGFADSLWVYLDTTAAFGVAVIEMADFKIDEVIKLFNGETAFVGFTSSSGDSFENHEILSWSFCPAHTDYVSSVDDNPNNPNNPNNIVDLIKLFPNPFSEILNITINNRQIINNISIYGISIYNMTGIKVGEINVSSGESFTWAPNTLGDGVYFIRIETGSGIISKPVYYIR